MANFSDLYTELVSAWPFDEDKIDIREDKHGSNDLTVVNDRGRRLCHLGHGINLISDDTSSTWCYIEDDDTTDMEPGASGSFTFSTFFREDTDFGQNTNRVIAGKADQSEISWLLQLGLDGHTGIEFVTSHDGTATDSLIRCLMPAIQKTHHVVVSYNGTTRVKKMYIDGELVAQGTLPTPGGIHDGALRFSIGGLGSGGLNFDGCIDESYYWNRELSEDEVALLWDNGVGASLFPEVVDSIELKIDFNKPEQLYGYRRILQNTLYSQKFEPSRYEIDEGEVIVDNRGRQSRILQVMTFVDDHLYRLRGISPYQGPDREIY